MAAKFILSSYSIEINITSNFKHYFTENLFANQFVSDTPFRPKRGHELIGVQKPNSEIIDVRKKLHTEIYAILKKFHGKLGKTVILHIVIPHTPLYNEIIKSKNVSNF